ncbi:MAG: capsular biosynthesis protein [Ideonella sp.]|nr:capsular biosynthesis protein [Ideonella sp.]
MIDLHTHILPAIDDGSDSLETSLAMARIAVEDGITVMACTPHIYPGLYMNDSPGIHAERNKLQGALDTYRIPLKLVVGADAHLVPELLDGLKTGRVPTLHGSRYFLLEPSHHVAPPHFEQSVFETMAAGFQPVLTHPERLVWIEQHYDTFVALAHRGVWMQITAAAVLGKFGRRARYWSERMLDEGLVHILASDAHTTSMRSPRMAEAVERVASRIGREEALRQVLARPQAILDNLDPASVPPPPGLRGDDAPPPRPKAWLQRFFGG